MWKIIKEVKPRKYLRYVLAECACGLQKEVSLGNIKSGKSKQCIKCGNKNHLGENNVSWTGYKNIPGRYWGRLTQTNDNTRKLEISITIEYINDLLEKQNFKCALSGIDIWLKSNQNWTASLDRIDSSKGYTKDNVQWVHKDINKIKSDFSDIYFIELCSKVTECQKNKPNNVDMNQNTAVGFVQVPTT